MFPCHVPRIVPSRTALRPLHELSHRSVSTPAHVPDTCHRWCCFKISLRPSGGQLHAISGAALKCFWAISRSSAVSVDGPTLCYQQYCFKMIAGQPHAIGGATLG